MYAFDSRIRYSETDSEGYLTLDALLNYFQDCSTFHSEDVGLGIGYMKEIGQVWVLSSWQIVVNRYPKLGEKVKIVTLPYELKVFLGYRNFAMLDEQGEVLRPSIIWCDQRTGEEVEDMNRMLGAEKIIQITANPAVTGFTAAKILWVKKHEPELYAKCAHILLPKDYIRYKLTGEYATEVSDASGMQLMDVAKRTWSDEILEGLGIEKRLLGKMYESQDVTGEVHQEAAALTGLAAGTIVVGGAGDNPAAAIGTGIVSQGKAFTTIGTSAVVYAVSDRMALDPKGRVHTLCASVPGKWTVMSCTQAAGLSLQWLRNHVCTPEMAEAAEKGVDPYEIMTAEAARVPIGSEKLIYLP